MTIAYDGITVVVNPANPVSNLTFDQLRGIYNGSISNWKDVGGEDKEIVAISRDSSSGTYKVLQGRSFDSGMNIGLMPLPSLLQGEL